MKLLVDRISKSNILDNISFSIGDGDRIALVGPNGAGKTTLLNVIMNLVTPTSGKIDRSDVKLAAVFQNNVLDKELTVLQNVRCRINDVSEVTKIRKKLKEFNINERLCYSSLSGGQKRIVNYLRSVAEQPNCFILDELSAGIDVDIRQIIWKELDVYFDKNKCGIIFTTHLLDELENANKILFISEGAVKYFGDLNKFMKKIPKIKLIFHGKNDEIEYFNTSSEAVTFVEKNKLLYKNFEIKKVTYTDLFRNMEEGM